MISAEGIFKQFGDQEVLKGVDFTFESGKTNLIIGRSGAGKTVLLKILVGLFPPSHVKEGIVLPIFLIIPSYQPHYDL